MQNLAQSDFQLVRYPEVYHAENLPFFLDPFFFFVELHQNHQFLWQNQTRGDLSRDDKYDAEYYYNSQIITMAA